MARRPVVEQAVREAFCRTLAPHASAGVETTRPIKQSPDSLGLLRQAKALLAMTE